MIPESENKELNEAHKMVNIRASQQTGDIGPGGGGPLSTPIPKARPRATFWDG